MSVVSLEKADVLRLRSSLPRHLHLSSRDIEIIEAVGSGQAVVEFTALSKFDIAHCGLRFIRKSVQRTVPE